MQKRSSTACIHRFRRVLPNKPYQPIRIRPPRFEIEVSGATTRISTGNRLHLKAQGWLQARSEGERDISINDMLRFKH